PLRGLGGNEPAAGLRQGPLPLAGLPDHAVQGGPQLSIADGEPGAPLADQRVLPAVVRDRPPAAQELDADLPLRPLPAPQEHRAELPGPVDVRATARRPVPALHLDHADRARAPRRAGPIRGSAAGASTT